MWLLNARTYRIKHFTIPPPYAILSHQWGDEEDEISFADIRRTREESQARVRRKAGWRKLQGCCEQALKDGLEYVWIDTCCINKESSAKLTEAINSMYRWYKNSVVCYAFLYDFAAPEGIDKMLKSRWFSRGWTLQELIAPQDVFFYDRDWHYFDCRSDRFSEISLATHISMGLLGGFESIDDYSVAVKMSWAYGRQTTREEDVAYCLMGLFDVNMPLLYGEGRKAFIRLQEEIIKNADDQTILLWDPLPPDRTRISGILAPEPSCFGRTFAFDIINYKTEPFQMTNKGLSLTTRLSPYNDDIYVAWLQCGTASAAIGIFLRRLAKGDRFARAYPHGSSTCIEGGSISTSFSDKRHIFVAKEIPASREASTWMYTLSSHCSEKILLNTVWYPSRYEIDLMDALKHESEAAFGSNLVAHWNLNRACLWMVYGFDFDLNPVCVFYRKSVCSHTFGEILGGGAPFKILGDIKDDVCLSWKEFVAASDSGRLDMDLLREGVLALKDITQRGLHVKLTFGRECEPRHLSVRVRLESSPHLFFGFKNLPSVDNPGPNGS
ncbi:hypothetical protein PV08_08861 [Exophiala spinifera]|uniref:Heterokaryon incompatibility domain-containing protein n=1 Tax=Exophiala spinifera TaxID=91928 RepID=A0A0D2B4P4_9EURO|nr:uncharacterized protein PV08_08861 [Exophiala spinifera]KIW13670.1 hypothetical protein PV08_08861 [Exophiala spinifera]